MQGIARSISQGLLTVAKRPMKQISAPIAWNSPNRMSGGGLETPLIQVGGASLGFEVHGGQRGIGR